MRSGNVLRALARRMAFLLPTMACAACGDVTRVRLFGPSGCTPLILGDSAPLLAQTERTKGWPAVDATSSSSPKDFSWYSSAPHIMSVNQRGIVVAKSFGAATITVRAKGFQDDRVIAVGLATNSVVVQPNTLTLRVGDSAVVTAQASDSLGRPLDLQSLGRLSFGVQAYPSPVAAEGRVGGATLFGRSRGNAEVNWSILGRCGIMAATVR